MTPRLNSAGALRVAVALLAVALAACASNRIDSVDITRKDPMCARECTEVYSSCVSGGSHKSEVLRACRDGYSACASTCPARQ